MTRFIQDGCLPELLRFIVNPQLAGATQLTSFDSFLLTAVFIEPRYRFDPSRSGALTGPGRPVDDVREEGPPGAETTGAEVAEAAGEAEGPNLIRRAFRSLKMLVDDDRIHAMVRRRRARRDTMRSEFSGPLLESLHGTRRFFCGERSQKLQTYRALSRTLARRRARRNEVLRLEQFKTI
jgi:hypothetical protein